MYKIKIEEIGKIGLLPNTYYSKLLEITEPYVSNVLNSKLAVKAPIAKGILSIAYHISLDDYNMEQLLEKHFIKEK